MMVMQKRSKVIHSSGTVTSTIYLSASLISCIPAQYMLLLYLALDGMGKRQFKHKDLVREMRKESHVLSVISWKEREKLSGGVGW